MRPKMVEAGQPIKVGELSLTVLQELSAGRNKRTYKVKDQRGVLYIYKYAKRKEIKKEAERAATLARLGLPHSKIVATGSERRRSRSSLDGRAREHSKDTGYVLREWIEGMRGDDWLKSWQSFGAPFDSSGVKSLFALFDKAARAGTYVGHLNPECLVYNNLGGTGSSVPRDTGWYIVECGSIIELPARDAATRYFWKVFERWGSKLDRYPSLDGTTDRVSDALAKLFDVLAPLGMDYPTPVVSIDAPKVVAPLSVSSKRYEEDSDDDDAPDSDETSDPASSGVSDPASSGASDDDDSSGDIDDSDSDEDDDDSSGSLPPDEDEVDVSPGLSRQSRDVRLNQNTASKPGASAVETSVYQDEQIPPPLHPDVSGAGQAGGSGTKNGIG